MLLFVIASVMAVQSDLNNNETNTQLVENIRRQLMQDNYDYLPTETEETLPTKHHQADDFKDNYSERVDYDNHEMEDERNNPMNDLIVPRTGHDPPRDGRDIELAVSNKDLLYYVNDERLGRVKPVGNDVGDYDELYPDNDKKAMSSKVKYSVLKVNPSNPSRRSISSRRLIQEEAEDGGVAIINMDNEPFPEFRLPKSRRQYMHDEDNFESDELPPLSNEDAMMETKVDDIKEVVAL